MRLNESTLQSLGELDAGGRPVTSVYADVDGQTFPRVEDAIAQLEPLFDTAERAHGEHPDSREQTVGLDHRAARERLGEVDRSHASGVALFLAGGDVLAEVAIPVRLRSRVRVADRPYVAPLEVLLNGATHLALVLVQRDEAEVYRYRLGHTWQHEDRDADEVPDYRTHQGSSDLRTQRHNQHWVERHYDAVAEQLRALHRAHPLDALVIAGPHEEAREFGRRLHAEVTSVVRGDPVNLPVEADAHEVGQYLPKVAHELAAERRDALLDRLAAAGGQAEQAAVGVRDVVDALNSGRVETLLADERARVPGFRTTDGVLALSQEEADAYGTQGAEPVDVIDELVERAFASSSDVEFVDHATQLWDEPVAALLRF